LLTVVGELVFDLAPRGVGFAQALPVRLDLIVGARGHDLERPQQDLAEVADVRHARESSSVGQPPATSSNSSKSVLVSNAAGGGSMRRCSRSQKTRFATAQSTSRRMWCGQIMSPAEFVAPQTAH